MRDAAADLVIAAMNFLDRPYRAGGHSVETGFDCSGFTRHLFSQTLGLELPRRVDEQAHDRALTQVSRDALRAGDLVFFNTLRRTFSHVGIYIGDGRFIHAPRSGARVRLADLPLSAAARKALAVDPKLMLTIAAGGDDYEVLVAVSPEKASDFVAAAGRAAVGMTCIGTLTSDSTVILEGADGLPVSFPSSGWDHF